MSGVNRDTDDDDDEELQLEDNGVAESESEDDLCLEDNGGPAESDDELCLEDNAEAESDAEELLLEANESDGDDIQLESNANDDELQLETNDFMGLSVADTNAAEAALLEESTGAATTANAPVLDSWQAVQLALGASPTVESVDLWRAHRCLAVTIAHALQQLPAPHALQGERGRGRDGRWLLWIVGARESLEGELARQGLLVEVLDGLCPRGTGWELALIGPEMNSWELPCGRGGLLRAHTGTLHDVVQHEAASGGAVAPDAAVLFNSGIGTLLWPLVEQWLPTMVVLLELDVPLLCACFNLRESEG